MDQLSAFIVHDLKTVNAQLALLAKNAPRHRDNPAFIDDMLSTVENAVQRTGRLVDQLRQRTDAPPTQQFNLRELLESVVAERSSQAPVPALTVTDDSVVVSGDAGKLTSALAHIVQNAQDATGNNGEVGIELSHDEQWITVDVCDDGCGMTREFINSKLFRPFTTTKGLAGIGIGAYQCREYIRGLGGDVAVASKPGKGTRFTLRLPQASRDTTETAEMVSS
jgi:putative PEP-CTERM system histidine kinase